MEQRKATIHLFLKSKWYDMIASGIKTEEYREIKPYWCKRILCLKQNDLVCFHRGYTNVTVTFMIVDLDVGFGKPEWGAPTDKKVFILKLKKAEMREY